MAACLGLGMEFYRGLADVELESNSGQDRNPKVQCRLALADSFKSLELDRSFPSVFHSEGMPRVLTSIGASGRIESMPMNNEPSFAVVIPFFNEEGNVGLVCSELQSLLEGELAGGEVILIDDGSSDQTGANLDEFARIRPLFRVFHLEENQGQSAALLFGFSQTTAPILVTMDGDGQNDAEDIAKLLARLEEADMVVGIRMERQDSWMRRKISRIANRVRSEWLGDGVSDSGCALKVFRREVASAFIPIRTLYSFMPSLAVAAGFRVVEEPVKHRRRLHGASNYSVRSFLILPIVDFMGLRWFRARRCQAHSGRRAQEYPVIGTLGEELYRRAFNRWLKTVAFVLVLWSIAFLVILTWKAGDGTPARKISLGRAERIALQRVPEGRIGSEQVRVSNGRPTWAIDVQLPASTDLEEIYIDAVDGHVITSRTESAAEEAGRGSAAEHSETNNREENRNSKDNNSVHSGILQ